MNEQVYFNKTQELYTKIIQNLDIIDPDSIEVETQGDHVTLLLQEGKYKFIINRQPSVQQVWLAAGNEGFYFDYDVEKNIWLCDKTQIEFFTLLKKKLYEYTKCNVDF